MERLEAAFAGFPPGQGFMYGVWLLPGVLGALVIRKRGAAVYIELVASVVSALLGTAWGLYVVAYGLIEGARRSWCSRSCSTAPGGCRRRVAAGAAAGAAAALLDLAFYYPDWSGALAAHLRRAGRRQLGRRRRARLVAAGAGARAHRGAGAVRVRARPGLV